VSSLDHGALILQIFSCVYMAGVISVIQLTHYPAFSAIDRAKFASFHARHSAALGFIAGPAMIVELLSALWLAREWQPEFLTNLGLVAILWFITFFVSVPAHHQLSHGFEERAWLRLVRGNWIRTFLWLGRSGAFLVWLLSKESL
jgi:hypothetical protein